MSKDVPILKIILVIADFQSSGICSSMQQVCRISKYQLTFICDVLSSALIPSLSVAFIFFVLFGSSCGTFIFVRIKIKIEIPVMLKHFIMNNPEPVKSISH